MRDKITVYGLLSKIYNGNTDMPKKINCCGTIYEWDEEDEDYVYKNDKLGTISSFLETHNDNLKTFLQDTVDIIQDNKIKKEDLFKLDESMSKVSLIAWQKANNGILKKQIDEIIDKLNEVLNEKDR